VENLQTDWIRHFLPAILRLLSGGDIYSDPLVLNPPWTYLMLAPVGILPRSLAIWMGTLMAIAAIAYAAWKVRKPYLIALVGISFPFMSLCLYGNLDWIVLFGVLFTNAASPFLLTVKPQAGALAIVGVLGKMRQQSKPLKDYVRLLLPFIVIAPILLILFPGFIQNFLGLDERLPQVTNANFSLFPYTLPLVPILLWFAYKRGDPLLGVLASLAISPYFYFHSIIPAMFMIADRNWKWGLVVNLLTWLVVFLILIKVIPIEF